MSIFTNKSTVELIPQNEINSDFGVLLFRSASFNKFDKSKYQNPDGTPNDLAVKKIYECLIHKHRSVFFGSRLQEIKSAFAPIQQFQLPKNDLLGFEWSAEYKDVASQYGFKEKFAWEFTYSISVFLAMKWTSYKPQYIPQPILKDIEIMLKMDYPACYKALQMLPKENVTKEEKDLLEQQRTQFISFKAELPIFIARQLYRSRGINLTERSGRYTAENTRFYKPDAWRKAPEKATQGSIENEFVKEKKLFGFLNYKILVWLMQKWFFKNVNNKNSKELCRIGLPQSQITTTINTVDLYTLSSILSQRLDKHAQLEIREVAQQLYDIACQEFGKELVDKLIDIQNRLIF
jgi:hypothetical protein